MPKAKPKKESSPVVKSVPLPLEQADVDVLNAHQAKMGKESLVTPRQGRAALAIFRAGAVALGYPRPT